MNGGALSCGLFGLSVSVLVMSVVLALSGRLGGGCNGKMGWRLNRLARPPWEAAATARREGELARAVGSSRVTALLEVRRWLLWGGVGATGGWAIWGEVWPALVTLVAGVWMLDVRRRSVAAAARRRFKEGLEAVVETMVASLRAGQGLVQAVEEAQRQASEPAAGALAEALNTYRSGTPLPEALAGMRREWPLSEVSYLVTCLETHLRTGGDVTVLLVNLCGLIRERRHLGLELKGKSTEARSTAWMLALLPPGLLVYILWADPSQLEPLLSSPLGRGMAAFAGVCWVTGVCVVQRLVGNLARQVEEEG